MKTTKTRRSKTGRLFYFQNKRQQANIKQSLFVYRNTAKGGEPDMRQEIQWSG